MYYFRADGSAVTGAGHLMRCLTVAQELQKRIEHPEELCFLCAEQASAELLQSWNMPVKILGTDPADLEGELSALEGLIRGSGHVFLVDSYAVKLICRHCTGLAGCICWMICSSMHFRWTV